MICNTHNRDIIPAITPAMSHKTGVMGLKSFQIDRVAVAVRDGWWRDTGSYY